MKRVYIVLLLIITVLAAAGYYVWQQAEGQRCVQAGQASFDLSDCVFTNHHTFELDGKWSFYWEQTPSEINDQSTVSSIADVPSYWSNRYFFKNDYPAEGYATYRATVQIPNEMVGKPLAVRINSARAASELYVNHQFLKGSGTVGTNRSNEEAESKSYFAPFVSSNEVLTIEVLVSNYQHAIIAGLNQSVIIGDYDAVERLTFQYTTYDLIIVSILFGLALFFLGKWALDRTWYADIWFAMLLCFMLIFSLTTSEKIIYFWFPGMDYEIYARINLLSAWCIHTSTLMFFSYLYPAFVARRLTRISNVLTLFACVLILGFEAYVTMSFSGVIAIYGGFVQLLSLYVAVAAWRKKSAEAPYMFVAILAGICYFFLWILNLLFSVEVYHLPPIFIPTIVISLGLAIAAQQKQLVEQINTTELTKLRHQIKPHFLFNALTTIIYTVKEDRVQGVQLIERLSEFLRGNFDFDDRDSLVPLSNELDLIRSYVEIESARFGSRLEVFWHIEDEQNVSNVLLPPLLIQPLVENAIRHGVAEKEDGGFVRIDIHVEAAELIVTIEDNGNGFSEQQISSIQQNKFDELTAEGSGIGLKNVSLILLKLYGRIPLMTNLPDGGASVTLRIPMNRS